MSERSAAPRDVNGLPSTGASIGLLVVLAAAVYQLLCAFQPLSFLNRYVLVADDAYYYFQVARNLARLGWPTFDGIHSTSGIQLAWGLVLAAVAKVVVGQLAFLRAVLVTSILLNVAAGVLLRRVAREMHSARVGEAAAVIWGGFMLGLAPTMVGFEYPLHAVVLLVIILEWWRVLQAPAAVHPAQLVRLGLALTVNYWVRLDAAILSCLIWIVVVAVLARTAAPRRSLSRQILLLSLPMAVGAAAYVLVCLGLAGTPIPLSGMVKGYYAAQHFTHYGLLTSAAGHLLWWVEVQLQPMCELAVVVIPFLGSPISVGLLVVPVAGVAALTVWGIRRIWQCRGDDPRTWHVARLLALMWVFGAIHSVAVVATIGHFSHVTEHYYGWLQLTWFLWGGLLVHLVRTSGVSVRARSLLPAIGLAWFVSLHLVVAVRRFGADSEAPLNMRNRRLEAITWINEHLGGVRVGAWNAGQVGYFCDCVTVNLDGLANDREFLTRLRANAPIEDYLRREGIQYLIDYDEQDLTMPYLAVWDHARMFRNTLPWTDLEVLYSRPGSEMTILVLRLRGLDSHDRETSPSPLAGAVR